MRCKYSKCKALADYRTSIGDFCAYHFKIMKDKDKFKKLNGVKIENNNLKKDLEKIQYNKNIQVVFK